MFGGGGFGVADAYLVVEFDEVIVPEKRHVIAAALDAALRAERAGRVTGGGTFLVPQESGIWTNIEVVATELEAGVRVLRHKLQELDAPSGTWIHWWEPEECIADVWFDQPPTWGW
jgi:hypothetical protein